MIPFWRKWQLPKGVPFCVLLAALRYLDRNPIRAALVKDSTTYPWSGCAAYALGTPNPLIRFHPTNLTLSRCPKARQRHHRTLLAASEDPRADARDPRWTTEGARAGLSCLISHDARARLAPRDARMYPCWRGDQSGAPSRSAFNR